MVDGFDSSGQPPRLASQRFYDDCHDSLQPGGILVVNLHHGHRLFPMHLERIRCSFDSRVLVVDDGDHSNSIVFACKGHALRPHRTGTVRVPRGLSAVAAEQLMAALTRVKSALRDPRPDAGNPI
jgi:spermidine synthase